MNEMLHCSYKLSYHWSLPMRANTSVWTPGMALLPPKKWSDQGQPPKPMCRDAKHRPISVEALALGLPAKLARALLSGIGASRYWHYDWGLWCPTQSSPLNFCILGIDPPGNWESRGEGGEEC